jgi:hypothetical protein
MKDRVDNSMGIITLIPESLTKNKPTDPKIVQSCSSQETKLVRFLILRPKYYLHDLEYTGLLEELEYIKIKTRLIEEKFASLMGECVI